jgi:hypothetical protein
VTFEPGCQILKISEYGFSHCRSLQFGCLPSSIRGKADPGSIAAPC